LLQRDGCGVEDVDGLPEFVDVSSHSGTNSRVKLAEQPGKMRGFGVAVTDLHMALRSDGLVLDWDAQMQLPPDTPIH
jgi:hypothetical protein